MRPLSGPDTADDDLRVARQSSTCRIREGFDLVGAARKRGRLNMPRHHDTIAALATPAGTAAIALLRISGPDTLALVDRLVGRSPLPRVVTHVDYRDRAGVLLDDVLLTYFAGPRSYTGEDAAEVTCHGNPFIAQKILEDLFTRGCRPAEPGEFTQRAFLSGRMDLSQAEAVMDLIHARSERALAAANDQLRGALGRRLQHLIDTLLAALARVEAYIDFPDEDLPASDNQWVVDQVDWLLNETSRLMATQHYGVLLRDGIKTVIVGEPNVGKSSLLNRLLGSERALVSPEPGTTRDFIEERMMVGAHCLRLIDTAGLNPSPAPLERLGMKRTVERLEEADLVIAVADASRPDVGLPPEVEHASGRGIRINVLNKCDLLSEASPAPTSAQGTIHISALNGSGIAELTAAIGAAADSFRTEHGEDAVAISARHAHALAEATAALRRANKILVTAGPVELVASELRSALAAYGEISGKVDNERMLDHLFATFCIGK